MKPTLAQKYKVNGVNMADFLSSCEDVERLHITSPAMYVGALGFSYNHHWFKYCSEFIESFGLTRLRHIYDHSESKTPEHVFFGLESEAHIAVAVLGIKLPPPGTFVYDRLLLLSESLYINYLNRIHGAPSTWAGLGFESELQFHLFRSGYDIFDVMQVPKDLTPDDYLKVVDRVADFSERITIEALKLSSNEWLSDSIQSELVGLNFELFCNEGFESEPEVFKSCTQIAASAMLIYAEYLDAHEED